MLKNSLTIKKQCLHCNLEPCIKQDLVSIHNHVLHVPEIWQ